MATLDRAGLRSLLQALRARGYTLVGPTVRDGAIVYDRIDGVDDLPRGWRDAQEAGRYRLEQDAGDALFDHTVGPTSWKRFLHPPSLRLWRARRTDAQGFELVDEEGDEPAPAFAFVGVRACDLAALAILDRVLLAGPRPDPHYRARREAAFLIAVDCGRAGGTCFCASLGTGPQAQEGEYDLALTELSDEGRHAFVARVGSERGREVLNEVPHRASRADEVLAAHARVDNARRHMGRSVEPNGVRALLEANRQHERWADLDARCMACANCTNVCPTCFCTTVEDATDLEGSHAERTRRWDSCFTDGFSYVHGGALRASVGSRYRHWISHKFAGWQEQFGSLGCVGCGRCITWCPVGIDVTEELRALRSPPASKEATR